MIKKNTNEFEGYQVGDKKDEQFMHSSADTVKIFVERSCSNLLCIPSFPFSKKDKPLELKKQNGETFIGSFTFHRHDERAIVPCGLPTKLLS